MLTRRNLAAMLTAFVLSVLTAAPVGAAKPVKPPAPAPGGERPLTPDEQAASDRKIADAQAYIATVDASGQDLVTLSCATPTAGTTSATTQACYVPQAYLPVEARDQTFGHYCGPAVGQVIANYSWAMKSGVNKYTQGRIAGWMKTDIYGLTNAPELEDGLEAGTIGSPRRPAGWDWVVSGLSDLDRDGTTADELQNYVRSNISGSKMPLAIPVKPHSPYSSYHLSSWPKAVNSPGHWIAAYGWYSYWTGTTFARIYYTDSSRDEGGSTGKYWDPTRDIAVLIMQHTKRFVW
jgi:hypothetical protein